MLNEAQKHLRLMSDEEQTKLILHLGWYALRVSNTLRWRTGDSVELPSGETIDSVVSLAFERVLSGERQWNPQTDPDITKYLMDVIDSLLYHLATGKDNTMLTTVPAEGSSDEAAWHVATRPHERKHEPDADWLARRSASPEQELLDREAAESEEAALTTLEEVVSDDAELTYILQAMRDGYDNPGEIAEIIGIDVREVYNAMKRLDRKVARVSRQFQPSSS